MLCSLKVWAYKFGLLIKTHLKCISLVVNRETRTLQQICLLTIVAYVRLQTDRQTVVLARVIFTRSVENALLVNSETRTQANLLGHYI